MRILETFTKKNPANGMSSSKRVGVDGLGTFLAGANPPSAMEHPKRSATSMVKGQRSGVKCTWCCEWMRV